jgi:hypothetical protein
MSSLLAPGMRALCGRKRSWRWGSLMHGYCSQTQPAELQQPPTDALTADEGSYVASWVEGSLGCIKLNRPQALNAMTLGAVPDPCIQHSVSSQHARLQIQRSTLTAV